MTTDTRVVVREDKAVALYELETRFELATRQRQLLEDYIKKRLQPDKHFYTVSDGQKPSLTKEGAELICLPHALKGHYQWLSGPENPPLDEAPYQITMKCELEASGKFAGEGVGSASSMVTKRDGTRVQRQKDPGLRHNATIKMACKSAYIAATLNSTAASEFFTQDMEDDQAGDFKKPVNTKEHWCAEHKTAFFMKGKMKSWAHPVEGTAPVVWCHEHKDNKPPDNVDTQTGEIFETEEAPVKSKQDPAILLNLKNLKDSMKTLDWTTEYVCELLHSKYQVTGDKVTDCLKLMDSAMQSDFWQHIQGELKQVSVITV